METPETEQPPLPPLASASEEQVVIILDSSDLEKPKIQETSKENDVTLNGNSTVPSPSKTVCPSPAPVPTSTPTSVPASSPQPNGRITRDVAGETSVGGNAEPVSPYINGGILNKRYSYSGSILSESMDMSIHKENMVITSRVSHQEANPLKYFCRDTACCLYFLFFSFSLKMIQIPSRWGNTQL